MPLPGPLMAAAWIVAKKPVAVGLSVAASYLAVFMAGRKSK